LFDTELLNIILTARRIQTDSPADSTVSCTKCHVQNLPSPMPRWVMFRVPQNPQLPRNLRSLQWTVNEWIFFKSLTTISAVTHNSIALPRGAARKVLRTSAAESLNTALTQSSHQNTPRTETRGIISDFGIVLNDKVTTLPANF